MARLNRAVPHTAVTHEAGRADPHLTPLEQLRRSVATCLLWEPTFYEKGADIAARIATLCDAVTPDDIGALAMQARHEWKLRHVPLWLVVQMLRRSMTDKRPGRSGVADVIASVIRRPDECAELVRLYWHANGRKMLPRQLKQGLARAFVRFTEYQLAKWNRPDAIKLRDVLFLTHAKPADDAQAALWKRLIAGELATPDTWEVALSAGKVKHATWTRLLETNQLGYMALLQNLRNMLEAGVDHMLIEEKLVSGAAGSWALPFRFVSAFKHAPALARALDFAMTRSIAHQKGAGTVPLFAGPTALVVDVSDSMNDPLSAKAERREGSTPTTRMEAATALAILLAQCCASVRIFTFSESLVEVGAVQGLGLLPAIKGSQENLGTYLSQALRAMHASVPNIDKLHRIIVITDEQSGDGIPECWAPHGYVMNVAPYAPGLEAAQHGWQRINGFSERALDWIAAHEKDAERGIQAQDENLSR